MKPDRLRVRMLVVTTLALLCGWPLWAQDGDGGGVVPLVPPAPTTDAAAPVSADATEEPEMTPEEANNNEIIKRQELEISADGLIAQARESMAEKRYEDARDQLNKAEIMLKQISKDKSSVKAKLAIVQGLLAENSLRWGEKLVMEATADVNADKFDEADRKFTEAISRNPAMRKEIQAKRLAMEKVRKQMVFRDKVNSIDPDKELRESEIALFMEQGKLHMRNGRPMDARDKFEQVLIKDPQNTMAALMLQRIYDDQSKDADVRRWVMIKERMAEIGWKWADPVAPLERPTSPLDSARRERATTEEAGIRQKLNSIIFPKISFDEATIATVVRFLKERSKELDITGEGVNIFLRLRAQPTMPDAGGGPISQPATSPIGTGPTTDMATPPADGGFVLPTGDGFNFATDDLPTVPDASAPTGSNEMTITMDFDNIPLGEAIRYICDGAQLKYRIEPYAVIIADPSVPLENMETRFYPVDAGLMDQRVTRSRGGFEDDDDDDDDSAGGGSSDPVAYFSGFGVTFPEGARISYDARTSKLIVYNTPENLRRVEDVLKELNIQPTQVTIEAKFVEVRQTTLQQLGFKWLFEGELVGGALSDFNSGSSFSIEKQPDSSSGSLDTGIDASIGGVTQNNLMTIRSIINDLQFRTLLYAIDKSDGTDLLSAPKVTTISGVSAVISFVQERRFPESFTEPEITTSTGGQVSVTPATPEFADAEEIGVIFRVTPTVAADGYSIDLELEPVVREFIGYDTTYNTTTVIDGVPIPFRYDTPIFEKRSIETRVIVWDGETVVLGGTIRDKVDKRNDKLPWMADLPVLGKLFQMNGELSEKRNLLVFVSARLVNPAGLPIRVQDIRGLPDFRR